MEDNYKNSGFLEVWKLIKEIGWLKTLFVVVIVNLPSILISSAMFFSTSQKINSITINNVSGQKPLIETPQTKSGVANTEPQTLGIQASFNPEDWIITNDFQLDKDGYYCHNKSGYQYWSMWTKQKYPVKSGIEARVMLKNKSESETKPPTLIISSGDFNEKTRAPSTSYWFSIFDTTLKTIKLYSFENKSSSSGSLDKEPNLSKDILVSLNPRTSGKSSSKLNVNPKIDYSVAGEDKSITWEPSNIFEVDLPFINIEDNQLQNRFGIGAKPPTCFKPISIMPGKTS